MNSPPPKRWGANKRRKAFIHIRHAPFFPLDRQRWRWRRRGCTANFWLCPHHQSYWAARSELSAARERRKTTAMMIGSSKWKAVSAAIEKQQTVDGVRGSLGPGNGSTQSNDHRSTHLKGEEMRKNEFTDDGVGQVFFLLSVSRCLCLCLCRSHLFPIPSSIHLSATAPPDLTRPLRRPSIQLIELTSPLPPSLSPSLPLCLPLRHPSWPVWHPSL